ncbi:MAG: hypothetical protein K8T90_04800 [Planctomycetes bacterium]|nr:hypothetical protein [Planctomycetota bacterium]
MTEPTQHFDDPAVGLPPTPVPPPRKAGRDPEVEPGLVLFGMLLGGAVSVAASVVSGAVVWVWGIAAERGRMFPGPSIQVVVCTCVWLAPAAALAWAIHRAARTERKALAIGMAFFEALAVLLAVACAGVLVAR